MHSYQSLPELVHQACESRRTVDAAVEAVVRRINETAGHEEYLILHFNRRRLHDAIRDAVGAALGVEVSQ